MQTTFAYMDGVIDPPSSIHRLTERALQQQAAQAELWCCDTPPRAAVILTPKPDALYIGKLCVAPQARGRGLARQMICHAASRAAALGLPALELEVRVELTGNHAAFAAMGFVETGRTAHDGYDRPTSVTYQRLVPLP